MPGGEGLRKDANDAEVEEFLHDLCTKGTLWSTKEGFFSHYVEQINEQVSQDFLDKFGKLRSNEERFLKLWSVKPVHTLKVQSFYKDKSREVSENRRADGNKAYQDKKYQKALIYYSQAVMRAPHDEGDSLALALANRSAVLHHLGHHRLCLTDIGLALQADYPTSLTYKVLDRRGQCLVQLGQYSGALEAFTEASRALASAEINDKRLQAWEKDLAKKISACQGKEDVDVAGPGKTNDVTLFGGPSAVLPHASSALSLKVSKEEGRFAVVNRVVPAGQVLMAERPYAAVLMDDKNGFHCTHCYAKLMAPVPCSWCSGVAFCSPECRDGALATYHRWECRFLDLLKGSGVSLNTYLALRIITQHDLHFFKKLRDRLGQPAAVPSQASPHRPDDYLSFYHLAGLEDQRSAKDFFHRALVASFLLKILQRAHFFGRWDDEGPPDKGVGEDEALVGGLLLRHLQVTQFNAHELSGMAFSGGEGNYKGTKSVYLGLAVYPTVSFCNHSCFPAVTRYFEGDKMVIVNIRPLAPGDVVAENYGPIFTHHRRQDRQRKLLSRYWFRCRCEACEGNWPVYDDMSSKKTLLCQTCKAPLPLRAHNKSHVKCEECGAATNTVEALGAVEKAYQLYASGCQLMDKGRREEAITAFTSFVDAVSKLAAPPLRELHLAMQSLRLLVASRGTIHVPFTPDAK